MDELRKPRFSDERRFFFINVGYVSWGGLFLTIWSLFLSGCSSIDVRLERISRTNIDSGDGYTVLLEGDAAEEEALGKCVSTHLEKILPGLRFMNSAEFKQITVPIFNQGRQPTCLEFEEIFDDKRKKQTQFPQNGSLQGSVSAQDRGTPINTKYNANKGIKEYDEIDPKSLDPRIQLLIEKTAPFGLRFFICVSKSQVTDKGFRGGGGGGFAVLGYGWGEKLSFTGHIFDIKQGLNLGHISLMAKEGGGVGFFLPLFTFPFPIPFVAVSEGETGACQRFGEEIAKFIGGDAVGEISTQIKISHIKEVPACDPAQTQIGTTGDDTQIFTGTDDVDHICQYGLEGNDIQYANGAGGNDTIYQEGGPEDDKQTAIGGSGDDYIYQIGGDGNDVMIADGGPGNDRIIQQGGAGDDLITATGGDGDDLIIQYGGAGNDTLKVDAGRGNDVVRIYAGSGNDIIIYNVSEGQDDVSIDGGLGIDTLIVNKNNNNFTLTDQLGNPLYTSGTGGSLIRVKDVECINVVGASDQLISQLGVCP
jgi:Ca2+-binding RTX toxin-like protein